MTDLLPPPRFVAAGPGAAPRAIAVRSFAGAAPSLVWLGGYRSDMRGTKAERLSALAAREGLGFCRFDYSGHGESGGRFEDGTISLWLEDAKAAIAAATDGPLILVGSSMGAWIALLLAREAAARGDGRLRGLLLLAPAPDFTRRLVEPALSPAQRADLETQGFCTEPSAYSDAPNIYTRALIEDGARNLLMTGPIDVPCPVHILQGTADPDVPAAHAIDLVACLPGEAVTLTLIPGGDHRLSREADLERIEAAALDLIGRTQNA
ncbi:2-hydroxymuconic semialdehyde hydrolase [Aureimonas endophytica]|uniref:Palmitoyl-protein thioesterase ABHD10, mitochondrial n=1 Tax=Aureimonas endophytica TaxID=2027858 RepID=A0A916ZHF7_9HYPH|nr:alpha/beta hydrolase [Aureimonas endophytica]GGD96154.1 2-hydroxymuconic semialdehyde hydrolase [Aureimonas endophytica]